MALQKISEFQESFTPKSRPDRRTIMRWIKKRDIYGIKLGGVFYIDTDKTADDQATSDETKPEISPEAMRLIHQARE